LFSYSLSIVYSTKWISFYLPCFYRFGNCPREFRGRIGW
jgi:hypothetical protein